jgi:1-acyl-sn-glycerol-3-phosphate acyltransferase
LASSRPNRRVALPAISPLILRWFTWYCRRYIRRHFHSLRVSQTGLPPDTDGHPLVIYTNHASWWDPLVGLVLKETFFGSRTLFAPIDAVMLQRYKMFAKLGFFAVEPDSRRGAVQFLRVSEAVLREPTHLLAVTPQSRFADVRERPVRFECGLGHLARCAKDILFLPMATELVFWEERLSEILVRFGEPLLVTQALFEGETAEEWTRRLELKMTATQDALSVEAQRRRPDDFKIILSGGAGQGGVYDLWRGFRAKLRGEKFRKEHGFK